MEDYETALTDSLVYPQLSFPVEVKNARTAENGSLIKNKSIKGGRMNLSENSQKSV
jgi:hypothetical protein